MTERTTASIAGAGVPDADAVTPELQAIADGLGRDPLRIYEWVKNTIDFTPYYGVKRGAHWTALERTGNDFDTSALLVALLKASGVTNARYRMGWVYMYHEREDGSGLDNWLGVAQWQTQLLLDITGCFYGQGYEYSNRIFRVWVVATIDGVERELDPSYKIYDNSQPVDVGATTGYSRSAVMSAAGGTLETVSGASVNSKYTMGSGGPANLSNALAGYTRQLVDKARTDWHNKSGVEIAGGRTIRQEVILALPSGPLEHLWGQSNTVLYDAIPADYGVRFTLSVGTLSYACYSTELRGRKLAIWFSGQPSIQSSDKRARLWLDDQKLDEEPAGIDVSQAAAVTFRYDYPLDSSQNHEAQAAGGVNRTGAYVVAYGFGASLGRLQDRLRLQASYVASDYNPNERELRTENLNIIALQYLNQLTTLGKIAGATMDSFLEIKHFAGIAGQTSAPFVDLPLSFVISWPRKQLSTDWATHVNTSYSSNSQLFAGFMYMSSALEHVTIGQTIPDDGVSTTRMLQLAAKAGHPVFLAKSIDDLNAIKGQLTGYTDANINTTMVQTALTSEGGHILLPKNLNMSVNNYKGNGYMLARPYSIVMGIKGGLSGGFATVNDNLSTTSTAANAAANSTNDTANPNQYNYGGDPVDLSNGAFYHSKTDLALAGEGVHGLALVRNYNSARRTTDPVGLGKGWSHSYDLRLTPRHPNDFDLQRATAADVAPFIIGFRVIHDILRRSDAPGQNNNNWRDGDARDWTLPAIIACWMGEQLIDSRASISLGDRAMEFTRLPDGSYAPPASVAATLVKNSNSTHTLQFRKGLEWAFAKNDTSKKSGRLASITDRNNSTSTARTLTATWTDSGLPSKITDAFGRTLTFTYSSGALTKVADSTGRSVTYARSGSGDAQTLSVTDSTGATSQYTSDSRGRITRLTDALGREVVRSTYDAWDRVIWQQSIGNSQSIWRLNYAPGVTLHTDPEGEKTWYYFDPCGRRVALTNELGHTTRWTYDGADRPVSVLTPLGRLTQHAYDRNHELIYERNPAGSERYIVPDVPASEGTASPRQEANFENKTTVTHYTSYHKPSQVILPGGITAEYQYETRGRISAARPASFASGQWITYSYNDKSDKSIRVTTTWPDGTVETTDYNNRGELIHHRDRLGRRTTTAYNNRSQPTKIARWPGTYTAADTSFTTPPAGSLIKTFTHDDTGDIATEAIGTGDPATDRTIRHRHNALGKRTHTWAPDGTLQTETEYDVRNLPARTWDVFNFEAGQEYDAAQRPIVSYDPLVRSTVQTYDAEGRPLQTTSPRGRTTGSTYSPAGFVATATDGFGRAITYGHDRDGRTLSIRNRLNRTWTTTYDDANRRVTTQTPLSRTTVTQANVRGITEYVQSPSGARAENIAFDSEGRVTQRRYKTAGGAVEATVTLAYYADGSLNTVSEQGSTGTKTTTRTYDNFGRLASYNDGEGNTIQYFYNQYGDLSILTYPDGKTVAYGYDVNGRLDTVTDWSGRVTRYTYDDAGRVTKLTRPNGTWRRMVYDAGGQVRHIEERKAGETGQVLWLRGLAYTDNGRTGDFRKNDGEITWTFDHPAPLAFTLPADTATYNNDNQLATFTPAGGSSQTVAHDANGNMTNGPAATPALTGAPALTGYSYDSRDRLIAHGGASYRYNPDGLRVQAASGSTTETYVVDPSGMSRVLMRTKGGTTTYYIWGLGLLYEITGSTTKTYHPDHLGSTVAITDSSGNVTDRIGYSPYGSVVERSGITDTPFLLHGALGVMTESNGLVYMRARYYHPRLQRFINADPIGFEGGMNWYAFVGNNPMTSVDPWGTCPSSRLGGWFSNAASSAWNYAISDAMQFTFTMGSLWDAFVTPLAELESSFVNAVHSSNIAPPQFTEAALVLLPFAKGKALSSSSRILAAESGAAGYGQGAHTVFRADKSTGRIIHYETKVPQTNPRNPNPWQIEKRFDGQGPAHFNKATQTNVPTPHVHTPNIPGGVRPPRPDELPIGY